MFYYEWDIIVHNSKGRLAYFHTKHINGYFKEEKEENKSNSRFSNKHAYAIVLKALIK